MSRAYPGRFITLEGGDGCGKTTLSIALGQDLEGAGFSVVRTREPGGTPLSEHVRQLLLSEPTFPIGARAEMLLFLAARAQHLEEVILPALAAGKIVLCERFHDSTIAYQACARHLGLEEVEQICRITCGSVEPDVTLLLDVAPAIALARLHGARDRLEQQELTFHDEVRRGYLYLADRYPQRIHVLDATATPHHIFQQAKRYLHDSLPRRHDA